MWKFKLGKVLWKVKIWTIGMLIRKEFIIYRQHIKLNLDHSSWTQANIAVAILLAKGTLLCNIFYWQIRKPMCKMRNSYILQGYLINYMNKYTPFQWLFRCKLLYQFLMPHTQYIFWHLVQGTYAALSFFMHWWHLLEVCSVSC